MPVCRLRRLFSASLAALACAASASWAVERDGGAGWAMDVPAGYRHAFEDGGRTLVLTPTGAETHLLRFTYHPLQAYVKERPGVGREFVGHLAAKKGLPTVDVGGNGGIAYVEPAVRTEQDGGQVEETAGALGLPDAYVTFTVLVDAAARDEAPVRELLATGLPVLLGRIRSTT